VRHAPLEHGEAACAHVAAGARVLCGFDWATAPTAHLTRITKHAFVVGSPSVWAKDLDKLKQIESGNATVRTSYGQLFHVSVQTIVLRGQLMYLDEAPARRVAL
jgi:hypothetical protein